MDRIFGSDGIGIERNGQSDDRSMNRKHESHGNQSNQHEILYLKICIYAIKYVQKYGINLNEGDDVSELETLSFMVIN